MTSDIKKKYYLRIFIFGYHSIYINKKVTTIFCYVYNYRKFFSGVLIFLLKVFLM